MPRRFLAFAAVSAFFGVALGAFGAHGLRERLAPDLLAVFEAGRFQQSLLFRRMKRQRNTEKVH